MSVCSRPARDVRLPSPFDTNTPFSVAFYLRRLLRVRKEVLAVSRGRIRGFFNSSLSGGSSNSPSPVSSIPPSPVGFDLTASAFPRICGYGPPAGIRYPGAQGSPSGTGRFPMLAAAGVSGEHRDGSRRKGDAAMISGLRTGLPERGAQAQIPRSEFPKNSINFDKFTGFFDKLL